MIFEVGMSGENTGVYTHRDILHSYTQFVNTEENMCIEQKCLACVRVGPWGYIPM